MRKNGIKDSDRIIFLANSRQGGKIALIEGKRREGILSKFNNVMGSTVASTSNANKRAKQKTKMKSQDVLSRGSDDPRRREIRGVHSIEAGFCIAFKDPMVPSFSNSKLHSPE